MHSASSVWLRRFLKTDSRRPLQSAVFVREGRWGPEALFLFPPPPTSTRMKEGEFGAAVISTQSPPRQSDPNAAVHSSVRSNCVYNIIIILRGRLIRTVYRVIFLSRPCAVVHADFERNRFRLLCQGAV